MLLGKGWSVTWGTPTTYNRETETIEQYVQRVTERESSATTVDIPSDVQATQYNGAWKHAKKLLHVDRVLIHNA